jgi:hypothetical protein
MIDVRKAITNHPCLMVYTTRTKKKQVDWFPEPFEIPWFIGYFRDLYYHLVI